MKELKIKKLTPEAKLPTRVTDESAGLDVYACIKAPLMVPARGRISIPTGIAVEIETGAAGFVFGRSGHGIRYGLVPSNAVGVIDSDYRGEIVVSLTNNSDVDYFIQPGERIAQLLIAPVFLPVPVEVETLSETSRGAKGIGSSGK